MTSRTSIFRFDLQVVVFVGKYECIVVRGEFFFCLSNAGQTPTASFQQKTIHLVVDFSEFNHIYMDIIIIIFLFIHNHIMMFCKI